MRFTVFTPVYNRAHTIKRLYDSLLNQQFRDFEWVVINDGSTDNTDEVFQEILSQQHFFPITYRKVENGGKHRAINKGVQIAKGELFFIVDSDDFLPSDSLDVIDKMEKSIPEDKKNEFAGVCGKRGFPDGRELGRTFKGDILDITALERPKFGIQGDKAEVFYTNVLKKYPFPEFEGENFITECVVWDKMANDGWKLRFFNEIVYLGEYLSDGLTSQGKQIFYKNLQGYGLYIYQSVLYGKLSGLRKWNEYLFYYYAARETMSFVKIAKLLKQNPVIFYVKLLGARLFYKLYS